MNKNTLLELLREHPEVHIEETDDESDIVRIEVANVLPKEVDERIRETEALVNRKTSTEFEFTLPER